MISQREVFFKRHKLAAVLAGGLATAGPAAAVGYIKGHEHGIIEANYSSSRGEEAGSEDIKNNEVEAGDENLKVKDEKSSETKEGKILKRINQKIELGLAEHLRPFARECIKNLDPSLLKNFEEEELEEIIQDEINALILIEQLPENLSGQRTLKALALKLVEKGNLPTEVLEGEVEDLKEIAEIKDKKLKARANTLVENGMLPSDALDQVKMEEKEIESSEK